MLTVDYEYTVVYDMSTSLNLFALTERIDDFLFYSKEIVIRKIKKRYVYGTGYYW